LTLSIIEYLLLKSEQNIRCFSIQDDNALLVAVAGIFVAGKKSEDGGFSSFVFVSMLLLAEQE